MPGTGTTAQAASFLQSYDAALDDYGTWLNGQMEVDFGTEELVMLPGWGERPGGAASEISSLLTLDMDEFNQGLDWTDLLSSLPDPGHSVAYTTYLDAPTVQPTVQLEDPADYLATLVAGTPIRLGGENTGNGTIADMDLCIQRAETLHFFIVQWMDEAQLISSDAGQDPGGPTLAEFGAALGSPSTGKTPPSITTTSLPTAVAGTAYSATLNVSAGTASLLLVGHRRITPDRAQLDPTSGAISGSPRSTGMSRFTVGVTGAAFSGDHTAATLVLRVSAPRPRRL